MLYIFAYQKVFIFKIFLLGLLVLFFLTIVKKLSAILLIALFLFNLFGYRILFNYAQQQSDLQLEALLDNDEYNEADLLTLKVPLNLPYQNNQEHFERVNGEITVKGKIYKYVKRKVSNGELVLLCIPNHNKMKLQSAKQDFFKYANDLLQNNSSKKTDHSKSGIIKNLSVDYDSYITDYSTANYHVQQVYSSINQLKYLPSSPHALPEQPPELI